MIQFYMDRVFHALAGYLAWCFFEMMTKKKIIRKKKKTGFLHIFESGTFLFNEIPMETFRPGFYWETSQNAPGGDA